MKVYVFTHKRGMKRYVVASDYAEALQLACTPQTAWKHENINLDRTVELREFLKNERKYQP